MKDFIDTVQLHASSSIMAIPATLIEFWVTAFVNAIRTPVARKDIEDDAVSLSVYLYGWQRRRVACRSTIFRDR